MPLLVAVNVLSDDDGVVDDDSEHQDEGEAGEHVDAQVQARHHRERAQERNRDPEADPDSQAQLEKQRQNDEDEHEPGGAAVQQERQPAVQDLRLVLPERQRDPLGQPGFGAVDVVAHGGRDIERALLARAVDRHRHRRKVVEAGPLIGLREAVDDRGHVAEQQAAAVGAGPEGQLLVVVAAVRLPDRAKQDLAAAGAHGTAGKIERGPANDVRDLVERESVPAQCHLRHLYGNLVRRNAHELDLTDVGQGEQPVAHALGDPLQGCDIGGAGDGDVRHLVAGDQLADDRLLRFERERGDCLDVARHLVEHPLGVGAGLELHDHGCAALGSPRHDLPDAVDVVDGLFDANYDPGFDFLRRGSEIGHLDSDAVEIELREYHLRDRRRTREAAHDDGDHQQVRRDGIAGQPFDRAIHGNLPRRPLLLCRLCPATSEPVPARSGVDTRPDSREPRSVDALARAMIRAEMR